MFGWLKSNPTKKLEREIASMRQRAVGLQRSGDLRAYAALITEVEALEDQLVRTLAGANAA